MFQLRKRILIASEAVGLGRAALRRPAGYANKRKCSVGSIGKNQGIQHPLVKS
ncbi:acyl-CoA dehydrogenase family protein [Bradyrhizobium macuxiense]|uniref:acyl-CoA dehydrogenase family protein n=1 Tax=Bradyrhizobium macuxiense TaxID=1755647 RepID=UPI0010A94E8A